MYSVKGKKPADLSRRRKGNPHVPHTTHFKRRDDIESTIPEPAKKIIADRLAQMYRPAQYDAETMMLEIYRTTRDACAAAGWPDSMAYQMRDYILGKVNDMKLRTYQDGNFQDFKIGEAYLRPAKFVDKTRRQRNVDWVVRGRKPVAPSQETAAPPAGPQGESRAQQLARFLLENDTRIKVRNRHNGQEYPAVGMHWPDHGWSFQIHDMGEEVWGRSTTGVGLGSVIDQGFQHQLEQRGWEFPKLDPPVNVREKAMKKLAGDMFARDNPPNPS